MTATTQAVRKETTSKYGHRHAQLVGGVRHAILKNAVNSWLAGSERIRDRQRCKKYHQSR